MYEPPHSQRRIQKPKERQGKEARHAAQNVPRPHTLHDRPSDNEIRVVGAKPARGYSSLDQHCWIVIEAVVDGKMSSRTKRMCSSGLDVFFVYMNERADRLNESLNTAVQTNAGINPRNEVSGKPTLLIRMALPET